MKKKERIYVKDTSDFDATGYMQPKVITWSDGRVFPIESVKDFRPAGTEHDSMSTDCYTIVVLNRNLKWRNMMNIKWNANMYTENFSFVHQYGNSVIELIDADRGSSVLDLGCGNGALTNELKDKGYLAKGLDASGELLNIAKEKYPDIDFMQGDAVDFMLSEPVDVVFSNAVFHWIDKSRQQDMLKCVYNALKKNGQFVFEFGGHGNNQKIHDALTEIFSEYGYCYEMPFYFPTIGEYAAMLESAGFQVQYAVLFDRLTELKGENGLKDWINMFVKTPFLIVKTEQEKIEIVDKAVKALRNDLLINEKWYADYVRIRMKAVRL